MSEPTKTVAYYGAAYDARQRRTVQAFAKRKNLKVIAELMGKGFGDWAELDGLLTCITLERVRTVLIPNEAALGNDAHDRSIALLALEVRDVRVLIAPTGKDLTSAVRPECRAIHDIALRFGFFEMLRGHRIITHVRRELADRRKDEQAAWRQMAATRRASAAQIAL